MWDVQKEGIFGPRKWSYAAISTAHGAITGYAWTKRGAYRKLVKAERWLYNDR